MMLVRDADTREFELTAVAQALSGITGERLRNKIRKAVQNGKLAHVLDLRGLMELDSATLAALIRVLRLVRSAGGDVGLIVEQEKILRILSITALDRVFPIFRDEEAAERALEVGRAIPA
jgi:anti-sigma B factor antagonist